MVSHTYALFPRPVSGHEVGVPAFLVIELAVWHVVDPPCKLWVCKDVADDLPGIVIPELVIGRHPLGGGPVLWAKPVVPYGIRFPGNMAKFDCVDC